MIWLLVMSCCNIALFVTVVYDEIVFEIWMAGGDTHIGMKEALRPLAFDRVPDSESLSYVGLITPPRTLTLEERFPTVEDVETRRANTDMVAKPEANGWGGLGHFVDVWLSHILPCFSGVVIPNVWQCFVSVTFIDLWWFEPLLLLAWLGRWLLCSWSFTGLVKIDVISVTRQGWTICETFEEFLK